MRLTALIVGFTLTASAVAQTPGRLQVEVTEELRAKPDACRLDFRVESFNAEASVAIDEVADELKRVSKAFAALKLDGVTLTPLPLVVARQETVVRAPRGGELPGEVSYRVTRPLRVVVEGGDVDALTDRVVKAQTELHAIGVRGQTNGVAMRLTYFRKGGWDDDIKSGLERATKRARVKAEGMATAAGESLGKLDSVEQVNYVSPAAPGAPVMDSLSVEESGEQVLRLRVRVVFLTAAK